jgi:hypothetical protein
MSRPGGERACRNERPSASSAAHGGFKPRHFIDRSRNVNRTAYDAKGRGTRRVLIIAASSVAVMAFATTLRGLWLLQPRPEQLAGFALSHGYDAHAPLALIAIAITGAWIGSVTGHYIARILHSEWAYLATLTCLMAVPWLVLHGAGTAATGMCFAAIARRHSFPAPRH